MAVNKVIYGNTTLVDLTSDTVTADNMAAGVRATGADGTKIVGLLPKVAIDNELSLTSTNPVQNKVIKEALDGKLGKNAAAASANKLNTNGGSATQPIYFANGVPVATTYTLGKSVPSDAKFTDTVYNHPTTHPASMITGLSTVATSGSYSDLSNKPTIPVVPTNVSAFINDAGYLTQHQSLDGYAKKSDVAALMSTKLGVTATAYAATRDGAGNNIVDTYARKTDIPNITVDAELSSTSTNPVQNKVIKVALDGKLGKNDTAVNASKVNNLTVETAVPKNAKFTDTVYIHPPTHPASMISGLATVATSGSYNDLTNKPTIPEQITVDSEISSTSTNPVQNKIVYEVLSAVRENLLTQINNLSAVAKSGSYNDLTDKPSNATTSSAGLMSAADKSKLDGISSDSGNVKMIVYS